jgi:ACS family sodium-dependent inorganic phosphate cotransporter-like MFS transporter 5
LASVGNPQSNRGTFDWDETRQTLIISAFFWGYIWTQIPGGKLGQRFGGKRVVAVSILSTAICNLFVPIAARASYIYVILLRVGMGLSEVSMP